MAISRVKTSSILQGFPKSRSLLAGNTYYNPHSATYVALGYNAIKYSTDTRATWTSATGVSGTTSLLSAASNGFMWVAVASDGKIFTSPKGDTWTSRTSGTTNSLNYVGWHNNIWIAVGDSGTILTSTDGTTWTSRTSGTTNSFYGATYGCGYYVACGYNGVYYSTNLTSWTNNNLVNTATFNGIATNAAGTLLVTGGVLNGTGGKIYTSTNGTTWTSRTNQIPGAYNGPGGVSFGNSTWFIAGRSGAWTPNSEYSGDGITWSGTNISSALTPAAQAFGGVNNEFFVVDFNTGVDYAYGNGSSWSTATNPFGGSASCYYVVGAKQI